MTEPILPYLTADLPAFEALLKQRVEDFRVEELPLYEPAGEGTHVYVRIEKRGIPTPAAVSRLARHLGVGPRDVGFAGLKDAQAIARQTLSIEHVDVEAVKRFTDRQVRVVWVSRHHNKLRTGHLRGNRFTIRLRPGGPDGGWGEQLGLDDAQARAEASLAVLARRGCPNYFGAQRFGSRGDTAELGRAIVAGDLERFVRLFLGCPRDTDPPDCRQARDEFDVGALDKALKHWPRHYADPRKALSAYKKKHRPAHALAAVDKRMRRLFVSAWQSELFNRILARRIAALDRLLPGDLARKTDTGGIFPVENPVTEQPRCDRFEISPTGALPGYDADLATGDPGRIEQAILEEADVNLDDFRNLGAIKAHGSRRALRFPLGEPAIRTDRDEDGECIELTFDAPAGCYATVVVEELCKNRQPYTRPVGDGPS
jgi:tRNA pseudouridine13 synthase